ncbi:MAG: PrsW family glutamic-type intramembrane protease [Roseburia sp.]|nr:PrsW family glutamic-type intramembrane protease [Roseburia sp.]
METSAKKPAKGKNVIAEFFKQTFRRHGGAEYSELLTRGLQSGKEGGVNKKYPWAYIRIFTLVFVLFAVFLLIIRFTSNEIFVPTVTLLGAVSFNLSFLLLLYELYPKKDLSFMAVLLAMLIGGAGSNVFSQIMFNIFVPSNKWLHAVYSGFFEEISKAILVILIIIVSRKNSPLAGFVFGAAVGCGFSIAEDMGYIFVQANEMPFVNLTTVIELSMSRGLSAVCTHTLWTAAIGWAFCRFPRHFANIAVYLVSLLSCGLHICWDLPLNSLALGCVYAACATVSLIECILILHYGRKKEFEGHTLQAAELYKNEEAVNEAWKQAEQDRQAEKSLDKTDPAYWRYWGHFALVLAAFLMAVTGVLYCSIPFRETYGTETFKDADSFVSYMQNGMVFNAEENRAYDERNTENDERPVGRVIQSVADENNANVTYRYVYTVNIDSIYNDVTYYFPEAVYATVSTAQGDNTYVKEDVYNDGKLYASFFRVNEDVTGFIFDGLGDSDEVTVFIYNPAYVRNLRDWKYMSLFCTFAGIVGVAAVCYISLVIKSWRVKKCSTEIVSSAK